MSSSVVGAPHDPASRLQDIAKEEGQRCLVPGLAVAVVKSGQVLTSFGLGRLQADRDRVVRTDDVFAIASDTKCFTAATVALLADEGRLDLDAPVVSYVPWFRLGDAHTTQLITARDLLAHRTGMPRHDLLRYGRRELTPRRMMELLAHLDTCAPIRQAWQYTNICVEAAGHLIEVVCGRSWSEVVTDRILQPLGMASTFFSPQAVPEDRLAAGHDIVDGVPQVAAAPVKNTDSPAGGMLSTADDMARWLLARLGVAVDGNQPLTAPVLRQLHTPCAVTDQAPAWAPERHAMGYGLGCHVESYRGRKLIRHGGNLFGFSSDVWVLPDEGLGIVVLTNLHLTPARDIIPPRLADELLGLEPLPWHDRYQRRMASLRAGMGEVASHRAQSGRGRAPQRALSAYEGDYVHPAYGRLAVRVVDDHLELHLNGLECTVSAHHDRDTWLLQLPAFDFAATMQFVSGASGEIDSCSAALEPSVAEIQFERLPSKNEDDFAGTYVRGDAELALESVEHQLRVRLPGTGWLSLEQFGPRRYRTTGQPILALELTNDGSAGAVVVEQAGVFRRT